MIIYFIASVVAEDDALLLSVSAHTVTIETVY